MSDSRVEASVNNEWDPLTKVFVGNPANPINPSMSYPIEEYTGLDEAVREEWRATEGGRYDEQVGQLWTDVSRQEEDLARVMAEQGVEVARPVPLTVEQGQMAPIGNWQLYPRDPVLAVGPYIIDVFCRMPFRRKEVWGTRPAIWEQVANTTQRHLSMPDPAYGVDLADEDQPYLEGGDIFVMNEHVLVGHSGLASSYAGIEWLADFLKPHGIEVHTIELTKAWLHLDCIFATPREGLYMCTTEGLVDGINGLPEFLRDWELIETTYDEAKNLGCNGVNLAPGVTVLGAEHERIIGELTKRDVRCVTVPYEIMSTNGGGPRCSTHPLQRLS